VSGLDVRGQFFIGDGAPAGPEFQVNSHTTNFQRSPSVAAAGPRSFVVVWRSDNHPDDEDAGVRGRLLINPTEAVDESALAGGTVTTDTELDGATAEDAVETTVTTPNAGAVTILERPPTGSPPAGFMLIGQAVEITAPAATALAPLVLVFELDADTLVSSNSDENDVSIFGDGIAVAECQGAPGVADPDPCYVTAVLQGDGDLELTVLSSAAGTWSFGVVGSCAPAPAAGCRAAGAEKSQLLIKAAGGTKDQLKWKWSKGEATDLLDFKDPVNGAASYEVCVYDSSPQPIAQPRAAMTVSPGTGWKAAGTKGFVYKDKTGTPDGIQGVKLVSGADGKAQVQAKGKGSNLPTPALPLVLPVTVQLVIDGGGTECWQTTYTTTQKSSETQFTAKGP
jgi:hypothetical protein